MSRPRSSQGLFWLFVGGIAFALVLIASAVVITQPAPVTITLDPIAQQTCTEAETLMVKPVAHVTGATADDLRFRLLSAPAGAKINPQTGVFTWRPGETHGRTTHRVELSVQSIRSPQVAASRRFSIVVQENNEPPVILDVGEQTVAAGQTLTILIRAVDPDQPPQPIDFRFGDSVPRGARMDPQSGAFEWTAPKSAHEHDETVQIIVSESGAQPNLKSVVTFQIHVTAADSAATTDP